MQLIYQPRARCYDSKQQRKQEARNAYISTRHSLIQRQEETKYFCTLLVCIPDMTIQLHSSRNIILIKNNLVNAGY
jgi:hypothetical protein